MTTDQLTLSYQLAQEALRAGLLSPESLEEMLRQRLKAKAAEQLFAAMDRMAAVETDEAFSPEIMVVEVRAMRAERRASRGV
jgi:hypothetical protein